MVCFIVKNHSFNRYNSNKATGYTTILRNIKLRSYKLKRQAPHFTISKYGILVNGFVINSLIVLYIQNILHL